MRTLIVLLAVLFAAIDAHAYRTLLHPSCPAFSRNVSWRNYMSGTIRPVGSGMNRRISGTVEVQFNKARSVNDPRSIGRLATNRCYQVIYHPGQTAWVVQLPGSYESWFVTNDENNPYVTRHNLPGDPRNWEINVLGVLLRFNDGGEVLNARGRVVGRLVCYFSDECGGY